MSITTDTIAAEIIVEPTTGNIDLIVDQPVVIVDAPAASPVIVEVTGQPGPPGADGPPGEPGPSAVSADAGNTAVLGSDSLIYVPLAFDEATADARYVNGAGDTMPGLLSLLTSPQVIGPSGAAGMTFRFADSPDLYANSIVNAFSGEPSWHAMEFMIRWNGQDRKLLSLRGDGAILFHGIPQFLTPGNVALSGSLSIANDAQDAAVLSLGHSDPNYRTFIRTSTTGAWITGNVSRYTIKTGIDGIEREIWRGVADGSMYMTGPVSIGPGGTPATAPLTLHGIAGQTGNVFQIAQASGHLNFTVNATGQLQINTATGQPWEGGIFLKNPPGQHVVLFPDLNGALVAGDWLGTPRPIVAATPTAPEQVATKAYVDSATPTLPPESDGNTNTSYGVGAQPNPQGNSNTAIGGYAQGGITGPSTSMNDAIGSYTQMSLNGGQGNMAMGRSAQYNLTNGMYNVGIGYGAQALAPAIPTTTASEQVAIGFCAGAYDALSGLGGVSVGSQAVAHTGAVAVGRMATAAGTNTVAVGSGTRADLPGSVAIGTDDVGAGAQATVANQIVLGTAKHSLKVLGPATFSAASTFVGYLTMGTGIQNNQPTAANHLTRKDYVDGKWTRWSGTQAQYDAIVTKDPNTLYVVV